MRMLATLPNLKPLQIFIVAVSLGLILAIVFNVKNIGAKLKEK